MKEDQIN